MSFSFLPELTPLVNARKLTMGIDWMLPSNMAAQLCDAYQLHQCIEIYTSEADDLRFWLAVLDDIEARRLDPRRVMRGALVICVATADTFAAWTTIEMALRIWHEGRERRRKWGELEADA